MWPPGAEAGRPEVITPEIFGPGPRRRPRGRTSSYPRRKPVYLWSCSFRCGHELVRLGASRSESAGPEAVAGRWCPAGREGRPSSGGSWKRAGGRRWSVRKWSPAVRTDLHLTFASGPTTFGRPSPQVLSSNLTELLVYSFTHFVFVVATSRQTLLATHPKTATVSISVVLT